MPADLKDAVTVVASPAHVQVDSGAGLVRSVRGSPAFDPAASKPLHRVPGLDRGITARAVEALHLLALATAPRYRDEVFDLYAQWGLLRYLGFFDLLRAPAGLPVHTVSDAGRNIVGNQRRVTSEEIGIGFGALLGLRWVRQALGPAIPISIVDVDLALQNRHVFAAGERKRGRQTGTRRPDYLLIAHDPRLAGRYRVRGLECKGTKTRAYPVAQLAKAARQLSGITVAGRLPAGLAVATLAADTELRCYALDPDDSQPTQPPGDPAFEITDDLLERAGAFELDDLARSALGPELASAALRASWAAVADFAGNSPAAQRWAPEPMRRKLPSRDRARSTEDTPYGPARGYKVTVEAGGQRARLRYLLLVAIDERLTSAPRGAIEDAQLAFADTATSVDAELRGTTDGRAFSATPDGSIFVIQVD